MAGPRTLTPLTKVRILVPQPKSSRPIYLVMIMAYFKFTIFIALLLFSITPSLSHAEDTSNAIYEDHGACPFECCEYREWVSLIPTSILKEMSPDSPVLYELSSEEKVVAETGTVITTKAGTAIALNKMVTGNGLVIEEGEAVYLLTYLGEGYYLTRQGNEQVVLNILGSPAFKRLSEPESVWWVKIKNQAGETGWTNKPGNFGNKDGCGSVTISHYEFLLEKTFP